MAEVLVNATPTARVNSLRTLPSWKRKVVGLTLLLAPTATTGLTIAGLMLHREDTSNAEDARQAEGLERCLTFSKALLVGGTVVLRASEIPLTTQADCGLEEAINSGHSAFQKAVSQSDELPEGTKISIDPTVTLPSEDSLRTSITSHRAAAESTGIGWPIFGGIFGATVGLVLGVGTLVGREWWLEQARIDQSRGMDLSGGNS